MDKGKAYPASAFRWVSDHFVLTQTIATIASNLDGELVNVSFKATVRRDHIHPSEDIPIHRFYEMAHHDHYSIPGHLESIDGEWHFWAYPLYEE